MKETTWALKKDTGKREIQKEKRLDCFCNAYEF